MLVRLWGFDETIHPVGVGYLGYRDIVLAKPLVAYRQGGLREVPPDIDRLPRSPFRFPGAPPAPCGIAYGVTMATPLLTSSERILDPGKGRKNPA